jgi:hypothetical protein
MFPARLEVRMDSLLPFLQGSCIPYNMPVYTGALRVARHPTVDRGPRVIRVSARPSDQLASHVAQGCS